MAQPTKVHPGHGPGALPYPPFVQGVVAPIPYVPGPSWPGLQMVEYPGLGPGARQFPIFAQGLPLNPQLRQSQFKQQQTNGTNAITLSNVVQGSAIIVQTVIYTSGGSTFIPAPPVDSINGVMIPAVILPGGPGTKGFLGLYYLLNVSAGNHTITLTPLSGGVTSASASTIAAVEAPNVIAYDYGLTGTASSGNSWSPGNYSPHNAPELLFVGYDTEFGALGTNSYIPTPGWIPIYRFMNSASTNIYSLWSSMIIPPLLPASYPVTISDASGTGGNNYYIAGFVLAGGTGIGPGAPPGTSWPTPSAITPGMHPGPRQFPSFTPGVPFPAPIPQSPPWPANMSNLHPGYGPGARPLPGFTQGQSAQVGPTVLGTDGGVNAWTWQGVSVGFPSVTNTDGGTAAWSWSGVTVSFPTLLGTDGGAAAWSWTGVPVGFPSVTNTDGGAGAWSWTGVPVGFPSVTNTDGGAGAWSWAGTTAGFNYGATILNTDGGANAWSWMGVPVGLQILSNPPAAYRRWESQLHATMFTNPASVKEQRERLLVDHVERVEIEDDEDDDLLLF